MAPSGAPHPPQNFSPPSLQKPQPGQTRAKAAPHSPQKRRPSRLSAWQRRHCIDVALYWIPPVIGTSISGGIVLPSPSNINPPAVTNGSSCDAAGRGGTHGSTQGADDLLELFCGERFEGSRPQVALRRDGQRQAG